MEYVGFGENRASMGMPTYRSDSTQSFSRARSRLPAPSNSTRQRLYGVSLRNASLPKWQVVHEWMRPFFGSATHSVGEPQTMQCPRGVAKKNLQLALVHFEPIRRPSERARKNGESSA